MWSISEVKQRGKYAFKLNYWKCLLAALIMGAVAGGTTSAASGSGGGASIRRLIQSTSESTGLSVGTIVALLGTIIGIGIIVSVVLKLFICWPLEVGCKGFFLFNLKGDSQFKNIGRAFAISYMRNAFAMLVANLIIAIGFLLFIIPGIVLCYSFMMVPYILTENPDMEVMEAIGASREMMRGHKWHAFLYELSFIGWWLLSAITAGILAVFYVSPYKHSSDAALYEMIKNS